MNSTSRSFDIVGDKLHLYQQHATDAWKREYERAQLCFDLAELINYGIHVFESITRLDEFWRSSVYKGECAYSADFDNCIRGQFEAWLNASRGILQLLMRIKSDFVARGFDLSPSDRLGSMCREAEGILTPDSEFFAHESLVGLRDEAIDQHHKGQTCEMVNIGD